MNNVWPILGIPATAEIPAIRRAYAKKLRVINQEKDPDAFMALRHAFTTALRLAGQPAANKPSTLLEIAYEPLDPTQPEDDTRIAVAAQQFNAAEAAGDPSAAHDAYQQLRALGSDGGPGFISPLTIRLASIAANHAAMPLAKVDRLLREIGLDAMALERAKNLPGMPALIDLLNERMAAETWLEATQKRAAAGRWSRAARRDRYNYEVARYITGRRRTQFGTHTTVLRRELDRFETYRRFVATRLDATRLDAARARTETFPYKYNRKLARTILFIVIAIGAVIRAFLEP